MGPLEIKGLILVLGTGAGLSCIYMGYRLYLKGVVEKGALRATGAGVDVTWKDYGPGVAFALFGAAVIAFCITRDLRTETERMTDAFGVVTEREQVEAASAPAEPRTAKSPPPR